MRYSLLGLFLLVGLTVGGCSVVLSSGENSSAEPTSILPAPTNAAARLPDLGLAPELTNEIWLNTESALRLADLRGKVVLIDMWTFG